MRKTFKFLSALLVVTLCFVGCSKSPSNDTTTKEDQVVDEVDDSVNLGGTPTETPTETPDVDSDGEEGGITSESEFEPLSPELTEAINKIVKKDGNAMTSCDDQALKELYSLDSSLVKSYSIYTPLMNVKSTEYSVFVANSKEDTQKIVDTIINGRLKTLEDTWSQYLPDQEELVKNYKLNVVDDVVYFIISDISDYAESVILNVFDFTVEVNEPFFNFNGGITYKQGEDMELTDYVDGIYYTINCKTTEDTYVENESIPKEVDRDAEEVPYVYVEFEKPIFFDRVEEDGVVRCLANNDEPIYVRYISEVQDK